MAARVHPIVGALIGAGALFALAGVAQLVSRGRRRPLGKLGKPSTSEIASTIRESIQGQVNTTHSGRILKACDAGAVDNLVTNIVGNLSIGVELMIDESLEEAGITLDGADIDDDEGSPEWFRRIDADRKKRLDEIKAALKKSPALIASFRDGEHLLITSGEMQAGHHGKFRVTTFGDDGPIGHAVEESMDKVAEEIRSNGYKAIRPATDDDVMAWTSTPKFVEGSKRVAFVQAANTLSFRAGARGNHDKARALELEAHKLAAQGRWDDATLILQQGIKDLGRHR